MEDWEMPYYIGMFGGMGLAAVLLYYKPDTSSVSSLYLDMLREQKADMSTI